MNKRILITGSAGFIGSNLSKRMLDEGWQVTGVDDLSNGELAFIPEGVDSHICDFADEKILGMIKAQKFDVVAHLAARPRVGYSVDYPADTTDINVYRVVKLMEACRRNVGRFINTSSSSVYGGADIMPTPEFYPHNPKSPYALQKSTIERYCELFSDLYDLESVSIRPFNVFGVNQKGDNPYSCAVSAWFYAVKHGKPLRSDGDGTQTRDITYVDNVVDIFARCANYSGKFPIGAAFNAGTGFRISNNEILEWFKKEYPNCEIVHAPVRPGDVKDTQASMEEAEEILGYKVVTPFWKGVELTKEWAMSSNLF